MFDIQITNEQCQVAISEADLRQIVDYVLSEEQVRAAEISVAVVDNPTIWRLNRRHLQHDYPTDVLSFLLESDPDSPPLTGPRGYGRMLSGEVIVSAEMASEMAERYRWRAQDELCLYLVHGLLHLCGYDDLVPEEQMLMRERERTILQHWNLTPHYAEFSGTDLPASFPLEKTS